MLALGAIERPNHGEVLLPDGIVYPIKWAVVNHTTTGTFQVVAAVASRKIRVVAVDLVALANCDLDWRSGTSTIVINSQPLGVRVHYHRNYLPFGWFMETAVGQSLNINQVQATATNIRGAVLYIEVP